MTSVAEHYSNLLAPVYSWMAGGAEAAFVLGESDLADLPPKGTFAVDLGAGFGMHTVPLARAGWRVLAVDSSPILLDELATFCPGLAVATWCGDLMAFSDRLAPGERPDLVLCMGDTLTHLESRETVAELSRLVASRLSPGGRFVATFRDYSRLPVGEARFIPVRSDETRVLTCFLEESGDDLQVHDLLHQRIDGKWTLKVSSYRKLRIAPEEVARCFEAAGLRPQFSRGPRGMVRLVADAASQHGAP